MFIMSKSKTLEQMSTVILAQNKSGELIPRTQNYVSRESLAQWNDQLPLLRKLLLYSADNLTRWASLLRKILLEAEN